MNFEKISIVPFHFHGLCAFVILHWNTQTLFALQYCASAYFQAIVLEWFYTPIINFALTATDKGFVHVLTRLCVCLFPTCAYCMCARLYFISECNHTQFVCVVFMYLSFLPLPTPLTLLFPHFSICCHGYRAALASAHQAQPLPQTLSVLESTPQVRGMHTIIR